MFVKFQKHLKMLIGVCLTDYQRFMSISWENRVGFNGVLIIFSAQTLTAIFSKVYFPESQVPSS